MRRVVCGKAWSLSAKVLDLPGASDEGGNGHADSPKRVSVGKEFDTRISLTGDAADHTDAGTRREVVRVVYIVSSIALVAAFVIGLMQNLDFKALQAVWNVVGVVYGGVAGYFFAAKKKKKRPKT